MRTLQIGRRIFLQLKGDPRFLAISVVAPCLIIYLMKILFDALTNPFMDMNQFIVPMAAFTVFFVTFILSAIAVIRERSQGTLARMFVNGFHRFEIISGYLTGYIGLASIQTLFIFYETVWLFDLSMTTTEKLQYILLIWTLALISISLGILISTLAQNEGQVFPFIPLIILPTVFFSGLLVEISKLPDWAQVVSKFIPFTYAYEGITGLMNGDTGQYWLQLGLLLLYGVCLLVISSLTLREFE
jgi:ABC-2 type transport system permease protein